jgi:hypothetical protein
MDQVKHRFLRDSRFRTSTRNGNALPIADAKLLVRKGGVEVKSSAHATKGYYDALAHAEHRARAAEQRLARIEQMLAAGRPDDEIRTALHATTSLRRRLFRVVSQTISVTR